MEESAALSVRRCGGCGRTHLGGGGADCPHCGQALSAEEVSGRGAVYSFSRVHLGARGLAAPYLLALIDLEEGGRVMARIEAAEGESPVIGAGVRFLRTEGGAPLFRLEDSSGP